MRAGHAILAVLVCAPNAAPAQPAGPGAGAAAAPVITCTSLANLRSVLRSANEDAAAAVPVITDPRSDLGCTVLDRAAVTGIAEHLVLNGRAYDCLALQGTSVCHWVVAGSAAPSGSAGRPAKPAEKPLEKPPEKSRR